MSLMRKVWVSGFVVVAVMGAACSDDPEGVPSVSDDAGGSSSSGSKYGSSGNHSSSGENGSTSGNNGSSGSQSSSGKNGSSSGGSSGVITGPSTTVTGVTFAPNGVIPLGQVTVSWSRTAPAAIPTGAFCSACAQPEAGTFATSAANGTFSLTVPVDEDLFITTQIGHFRRVRSYRFAQSDTTLAQATTTLPARPDPAGDTTPSIGIFSEGGGYDKIADALDELGVKGLVNLTRNDLANPVELQRYHLVLVPGAGSCNNPRAFEPSVQSALRQYVAGGGAFYTSDYSYEYFNRAFPGFVQFAGDGPGEGCVTAHDASGRYDDAALSVWMGAAADGNQFGAIYTKMQGTITQPGPGRNGATVNLTPKVWATTTAPAPATPSVVSVPYGCGQAIYSSMLAGELTGSSAEGLARGRALSFILFRAHDGCVTSPAPACAGSPGAACTPGQPPVAGASCGYCGTNLQRCSDQCTLLAPYCQGEQAAEDRCLPGETRLSNAGCANPSEVRSQACHSGSAADPNRCTWEAPAGACAGSAIPYLSVTTGVGSNVTRSVTAAEQAPTLTPTNFSGCPAPGTRTRIGALTEIRNDTGAPIKVDVTVTPKRQNGYDEDRLLVIYNNVPPYDEATVRACGVRNDDCALASMPDVESCVEGIAIPSGGRIWALVHHFTEAPPPSTFSLHVKRTQ